MESALTVAGCMFSPCFTLLVESLHCARFAFVCVFYIMCCVHFGVLFCCSFGEALQCARCTNPNSISKPRKRCSTKARIETLSRRSISFACACNCRASCRTRKLADRLETINLKAKRLIKQSKMNHNKRNCLSVSGVMSEVAFQR